METIRPLKEVRWWSAGIYYLFEDSGSTVHGRDSVWSQSDQTGSAWTIGEWTGIQGNKRPSLHSVRSKPGISFMMKESSPKIHDRYAIKRYFLDHEVPRPSGQVAYLFSQIEAFQVFGLSCKSPMSPSHLVYDVPILGDVRLGTRVALVNACHEGFERPWCPQHKCQ